MFAIYCYAIYDSILNKNYFLLSTICITYISGSLRGRMPVYDEDEDEEDGEEEQEKHGQGFLQSASIGGHV